MGTFVGHVAPGLGFMIIGLWHLFNHIKAHSVNPTSYKSHLWFPTTYIRHLELLFIMAGSTLDIAAELFIGPNRHHPLDPDGTIPSNHLHNVEHALIAFSFFIYAAFAIVVDCLLKPNSAHGLTQLLAAHVFTQQLLLVYVHSVDHTGLEAHYHWLFQIIVLVSLSTTLIGIANPDNFLISFVRSLSISLQGVWLILMGYMLWTPWLLPKGCRLNSEVGHQVVQCKGNQALSRAKALVNLQFSLCLISVMIFSTLLYLGLLKRYEDNGEYYNLDIIGDNSDDEEFRKRIKN